MLLLFLCFLGVKLGPTVVVCFLERLFLLFHGSLIFFKVLLHVSILTGLKLFNKELIIYVL